MFRWLLTEKVDFLGGEFQNKFCNFVWLKQKDKMQIDMNELQNNYNPLAISSEFVRMYILLLKEAGNRLMRL